MMVTKEKIMEVAKQISVVFGLGVSYDTNCSVIGAEKPIEIAGPEAIEKSGAISWESTEFTLWLAQEEEEESGRKISGLDLKEILPVDDGKYGKFVLCFRRWVEPTKAEREEFHAEYGVDSEDLILELYGARLMARPIEFYVTVDGNEVSSFLSVVAPYHWGTPLAESVKTLEDEEFYIVGRLDDVVFNDYWPVRHSNIEYIGKNLEIAEEAFSELTAGDSCKDQYNFLGKLSTDGTVESIKGCREFI